MERKSPKKSTAKSYSEQQKRSYLRLRTARRSMAYIVRTIMVLIAVILLSALAFLTAERMSNLYILTSEGMALRAECVLSDGDRETLEEYFLLTCISEDVRLNGNDYANYTVSSYNYDLAIEGITVMPWAATATVTVVETVSVKGSIDADLIEENKTAADYPLPAWETARIKLHYVNTGERWYVSELETLETNPDAAALRTPDMSQKVLPMATPTPSPDLVDLGW